LEDWNDGREENPGILERWNVGILDKIERGGKGITGVWKTE